MGAINSKVIDLHGRNITDERIQPVWNRNNRHIQTLRLQNNKLTSRGLLNFSKVSWTNLTQIVLTNNPIGDKGCKNISRASLPNLVILKFRNNQIGRAGIIHLSKGQWKNLKQLFFHANKIGADYTNLLVKGNWMNIQQLLGDLTIITYHQVFALVLSQFCKFDLQYFLFQYSECQYLYHEEKENLIQMWLKKTRSC